MAPIDTSDRFFDRPTIKVVYYGIIILLTGSVSTTAAWYILNGKVDSNTKSLEAHEEIPLHPAAVKQSDFEDENKRIKSQIKSVEDNLRRDISAVQKEVSETNVYIRASNEQTSKLNVEMGAVKAILERVEKQIDKQ